jgi:hypothetical protein
MNYIDQGAFRALFREACLKCFGHVVSEPLTETEAKLFYARIFDATGLVVGWKTIKNYSAFLLGEGKPENPSVATLDTLTRYVQAAPYTTEADRKKLAGHFPFWFGYREVWAQRRPLAVDRPAVRPQRRWWLMGIGLAGVVLVVVCVSLFFRRGGIGSFREDFQVLQSDSMAERGWWVASKDAVFWDRRAEKVGCLTLFTLAGDNWPDPVQSPVIRNLVLRRIPCDCFTLELHLRDFIPEQNWQQAGVLLAEDTSFGGRSLRVSIAYNDFNGVYPRAGSILVQVISSQASGKPEEIAHVQLFSADSLLKHPGLVASLAHSALRIEKRGNRFRIMYADGILPNTSFREIATHELAMQPRYAGLFALKGFVDSSDVIPARFDWFSLDCEECR